MVDLHGCSLSSLDEEALWASGLGENHRKLVHGLAPFQALVLLCLISVEIHSLKKTKNCCDTVTFKPGSRLDGWMPTRDKRTDNAENGL
jgi:hypothetical protein